ncbi:hypothetical protein ACHWQZ_G012125 [Mnemiopsis leidyi]
METSKIIPGDVAGMNTLLPGSRDLRLTPLSSTTLFIVMVNVLGGLTLVIYFLQKSRKSCSTLLYLLLLIGDLISSATGIFACFSLNRYQQNITSNSSQPVASHNNSLLPAAPNNSQLLAAPNNSQLLAAPNNSQLLAAPNNRQILAAPNSSRLLRAKNVSALFAAKESAIVAIETNEEWSERIRVASSIVLGIRGKDYSSVTFNLVVFQIIPNGIPCLLILAVAVNTFIYYLRHTASRRSNSKLLHSCMTVILYSVTFTFTTVPYIVSSFSYYLNRGPAGDHADFPIKAKKQSYVFLTLFLYLRSLLTIVVFATRSSGFRHFVKQIKRRNVRILSFVNPELDQAIQTSLRDKEFQDRIRRHVSSNPAVRTTALSVRWDRKVRVHKVGTIDEVPSSSSPSPTLAIRTSPLPTISESSE